MEWAHAIGQGIAGAAKAGADIIDTNMKRDAQIEAEQRAADMKLATAERLAAIQEAMQNRAAERFAGGVKAKMGEEVPVEAAPVDQTGVSRESAKAIGLVSGLKLTGPEMKKHLDEAKATLANPSATAEQKDIAQLMIDQLGRQAEAQAKINGEAVGGKTRKRTLDEAAQAALDDALMNDAPAYMAGTGMLAAANKSKVEMSKIEREEKLKREEMGLKAQIEREKIDQRDADSVRDSEAASARVKALADRAAASGKGSNKTAMIQNIEYMTSVLKYTPEQVEAYVFEKKGISEKELAANILSKDKYGEMTPADAAARARSLSAAFDAAPAAKPAASSASAAPAAGPKKLKWNPSIGKFE